MLLGALAASGLLLAIRWGWPTRRGATPRRRRPAPTLLSSLIGFVTNFFDTLGIGSFATTTAVFRLLRLVPDELIPGTMIVGHALPVVTQALFFISVVDVDPVADDAAHRRLRGWRMAGRRRRRLAVAPRGAARDGLCAAHRGRVHDARHARPVSGGRHGARLRTARVRARARGQLRPWRAGHARDRQLRAEPDRVQPARDGPAGGVSDHDGIGCVRRDDRRRPLRQRRALPLARGPGPDRSEAFRA